MRQSERGHCHAKEGHLSGLAWGTTFSVFLWVFFQNHFWIVSSSHSLTFWHEMSPYYSTWIPKSNQHNLANRWWQPKLLQRWGTSSFPLLWLSFCFRFSIMNPLFISSDNTVQTLIFIVAETTKMFFCYGHPGCLLVFCQLFLHPPCTYIAHTYFFV